MGREILKVLNSATMEERERERKLRASWRRRPPFIGASKSNRYV
jgi:hypothetical protein